MNKSMKALRVASKLMPLSCVVYLLCDWLQDYIVVSGGFDVIIDIAPWVMAGAAEVFSMRRGWPEFTQLPFEPEGRVEGYIAFAISIFSLILFAVISDSPTVADGWAFCVDVGLSILFIIAFRGSPLFANAVCSAFRSREVSRDGA